MRLNNINKFQYFFAFYLFFLLFNIDSYAAYAQNKQLPSVEEFITKQTIVRTYEPYGSPGFGDQATILSSIDRLRQIGFKGTFEFIYDPNTKKIPILFNLPENIPSDYLDKDKLIRFITYAEYHRQLNANTILPVTFAITSAQPDFTQLGAALKQYAGTIPWDETTYPLNNDAYLLKSKAAFAITSWMNKGCLDPNNPDDDSEFSAIYLDHQPTPIKLCHSGEQFLVAPFSTYQQAKSYLANDARGQKFLKDKPAFNTFLSIIDNQSADILFAYGNGIKNCGETGNCSKDSRDDLQSMLGIISGVRNAQLHKTNNTRKPVIVAVFKNHSQTANDLEQLINNQRWNEYDFPGKQKAREVIEKQQLMNAFEVTNLSDPDAEQKLSHLQANHILILELGSLPKIVFDGIYNHTAPNIWPAIREGENAKNSLVLTGRPHLRVTTNDGDWEPSLVGFGPDQFDSQNKLNEKYNNLAFPAQDFWVKLQPDEMIGHYILDAIDSGSDLSKYFIWLKEQALKPENDRIYSGLSEVINKLYTP